MVSVEDGHAHILPARDSHRPRCLQACLHESGCPESPSGPGQAKHVVEFAATPARGLDCTCNRSSSDMSPRVRRPHVLFISPAKLFPAHGDGVSRRATYDIRPRLCGALVVSLDPRSPMLFLWTPLVLRTTSSNPPPSPPECSCTQLKMTSDVWARPWMANQGQLGKGGVGPGARIQSRDRPTGGGSSAAEMHELGGVGHVGNTWCIRSH